ncbi:MAG: trans-aconitate 2-methyltransferase, partial [Chloroflexota bacterium]|nr:trans-aconitate 2-methyltransferase [Chloroflexota bacterium]
MRRDTPAMTTPRDWDAATYDRVADPMTRWGTGVLDRLPLHGHEAVLDAGCGSGRVTEALAERLPRGRVV